MRVTLTGAAGNIGSRVCQALLDGGHVVLATDKARRNPTPVALHVADLLDREAVAGLFDGAEAVVHLGNHAGFGPPDPQMIFNENVSMNMNVFQSAIDAGVKKIVFASSIQAVVGLVYPASQDEVAYPSYLPMDGEMPARPVNPYALSKQVGEVMLQHLTQRYALSAVALRLPHTRPAPLPPGEARPHDCFSYLTCGDVGDLILAILARDLPGFRVYLPANTSPPADRPLSDVIRQHYRGIPLRRPVEQIDSLVDVSRITTETGWLPRDRIMP